MAKKQSTLIRNEGIRPPNVELSVAVILRAAVPKLQIAGPECIMTQFLVVCETDRVDQTMSIKD